MNTSTGQLYILSAPSGAGKSSLLTELAKQLPTTVTSISHTTRSMRPGEQEGVHYYFVSVETFRQQIDAGNFLEYAQVFDNYYGTSRQTVEKLLNAGKDVILEIDWQGARQVRFTHPSVISIFILPPSIEALSERLHKRGQDSDEVIQRRMRAAQTEMAHYPEYDFVVINDDFATALAELSSIFRSERLRLTRQIQHNQSLFQSLLS